MSSLAETVKEVATSFTGQLLQPSDAGYDAARRVHNGLIDKRPALIARCQGVADVSDAVKMARALNLEVAVRGGGHNVAGRATIDGGLMIDLAPMKGIQVDPKARVARAQGAYPGQVIEAELEDEGGMIVYEIKMLTADGRVMKLSYNAATGELLKTRVRGGQR